MKLLKIALLVALITAILIGSWSHIIGKDALDHALGAFIGMFIVQVIIMYPYRGRL